MDEKEFAYNKILLIAK